MWRVLRFLGLVLATTGIMVWLLDQPGFVSLDWLGYRIETSAALLTTTIAVIAASAAIAYRIFLALWRTPAQMGEAWRDRRRQKGYRALTRGLVAVAAGDSDEARRQEKLAQALLNEPPLTMLLSAQTAQLNGDETAATRFFQAMTEKPDTEFLGVRGMLNQALARGDDGTALELARQAYRLRPQSGWVTAQLFDLQIRNGQWLDAQITNDEQVCAHHTDKGVGRRRKAVLAFQQGLDASAAGDSEGAAKYYKIACNQDSAFTPAVVAFANSLMDRHKNSKAADIIERAWRLQPHPDLVLPFWRSAEAGDGLAIMKATEQLARANPAHPESKIALARAALEARLWGEARTFLEAVTTDLGNHDETRICRLWAKLEEAEHQDTKAARAWLTRASLAEKGPAWVCGKCGNSVAEWSSLCGNCDQFNSLSWGRPRHVSRVAHTAVRHNPPITAIGD
ncbi:MAG: heme biosynthesis protein HemY [Magnetovibrio sp.]|nr:heme biosynthesis protein HemY [Magnetovibrio sp.]